MEKIAVPISQGKLSLHFGHCDQFAIALVEDGQIKQINYLVPPQHAPGVYPQWLAQEGVKVIITGGMGTRAQQLFSQNGIRVVFSRELGEAENLINKYLAGALEESDNTCEHEGGHEDCPGH